MPFRHTGCRLSELAAAWPTREAGEKGIAIFAPLLYRGKQESVETHEQSNQENSLHGFRVVHVFDISQTDGQALPTFAEVNGDPADWLDRLEHLTRCRNIDLKYVPYLGGADGATAGGSICILEGLSPARTFVTLVHEIAHVELHSGGRRGETTPLIRETEAEAVAFVVSRAMGLDCLTHSADYIQLYRGDVTTLTESMQLIQSTAAGLLSQLTQSLNAAA